MGYVGFHGLTGSTENRAVDHQEPWHLGDSRIVASSFSSGLHAKSRIESVMGKHEHEPVGFFPRVADFRAETK